MRTIFALAALLALTGAAQAQGGVKIGVLSCKVDGGFGLILGSRKGMTCTFDGPGSNDERYTGAITKLGIDVGATEEAHITWAVLAPASSLAAGALAGTYVGITAEATGGVGLGANALVGGLDRSIALQPLSLSEQVGVNLAAGIASMTLRDAEPVVIVQ